MKGFVLWCLIGVSAFYQGTSGCCSSSEEADLWSNSRSFIKSGDTCLTRLDVDDYNEINQYKISFVPCQDEGKCRQFDTKSKRCFPPVVPPIAWKSRSNNNDRLTFATDSNFISLSKPVVSLQQLSPVPELDENVDDDSEIMDEEPGTLLLPIDADDIVPISISSESSAEPTSPPLRKTPRRKNRRMKKNRRRKEKKQKLLQHTFPTEIELGPPKDWTVNSIYGDWRLRPSTPLDLPGAVPWDTRQDDY